MYNNINNDNALEQEKKEKPIEPGNYFNVFLF